MEIHLPDLDDVEFVTKCGICGGSGKTNPYPKPPVKCFRCEGKGKVLTSVGERLLNFLRAVGVPVTKSDDWPDALV